MAYNREEQETTLVFEASTNAWRVYSNVPKHMRKLAELTELNVLEMEEDGITPKAVSGILTDKQVSMKKARVMSEEQRQAAADRLRKAQKLREESAK